MNQDLKAFIVSMLRIVLPAILLVATVAFISVPYTLGHHPGEQGTTDRPLARHMT